MLTRALILLLLILNVGVACWWAFAPDHPTMEPAPPSTVPRLQLLGEGPPASRPRPAASAARATGTDTSSVPAASTTAAPVSIDLHCWRFGPFADAAALSRAQAWLQTRVSRSLATTLPGAGRGWRVWLPPLADHDTAQAMAQQIAAAGFSDYYVVPDGAEANSIALGRYGNADAAQRRQAALQSAGFGAKAEALGATTRWIDVAGTSDFDADAARAAIGASQGRAVDCAQLH